MRSFGIPGPSVWPATEASSSPAGRRFRQLRMVDRGSDVCHRRATSRCPRGRRRHGGESGRRHRHASPTGSTYPRALRWIEVDAPKIIELEGATPLRERGPLSARTCRASMISNGPARRGFLGHLRGDRVVVLTEGVIAYLENDAVSELARDLRGHPQSAVDRRLHVAHTSSKHAEAPLGFSVTSEGALRFEPADWDRHFEKRAGESRRCTTWWRRGKDSDLDCHVQVLVVRRPMVGSATRATGLNGEN